MNTPPTQTPPDTWTDVLSLPLGTLGAFIGAALGAFIVNWGARSGFYVIPVIGMLAGWGATLAARKGTWLLGAIAGLITAAVGLWAEWKFITHWKADDSFTYFLTHLTDLASFKLFLHAVGVALAVWFAARK